MIPRFHVGLRAARSAVFHTVLPLRLDHVSTYHDYLCVYNPPHCGRPCVSRRLHGAERSVRSQRSTRTRRQSALDAVGCSANAEAPKIYIKPVAQRSGRPRVILGFAEPILLGAAAETQPEDALASTRTILHAGDVRRTHRVHTSLKRADDQVSDAPTYKV